MGAMRPGQGGAVAARGPHKPEDARSSRAPDPNYSVSFTLGGTPSNWAQGIWQRHWSKAYKAKREWLERAIIVGAQARIKAHWPKSAPAARREVEIRCYRVRLMDHDGAVTSIKPILDGCKNLLSRRHQRTLMHVPGAGLIYDDSPEYVDLKVAQVKVGHRAEERTEVTIRIATDA